MWGDVAWYFVRLPSHYRSIEEHVWPLDLDFVLRDFTLDPAQDLLVLIGQPLSRPSIRDARMEISMHLRSLSTGKAHPLATKSSVLMHDIDPRTATLTFMLQIHSDRVAVHFVSRGIASSDLVVWNWKTGETLLNTYSANLMAFAFLTERLILVGDFSTLFDPEDSEIEFDRPRLTVVDLDSCGCERTQFEELEHLCAFHYPVCHPSVQPLDILIRSDPSTDWTPHTNVRVPFSVGPGHRLYIVTIRIVLGGEICAIDLFVLSDTLLERIGALGEGETEHHFTWTDWGPNGTRMIAQAQHSYAWVCYVFGTRFSSVTSGGGQGNRHNNSRTLEVWDFNQLGIKRDIRLEGARSSEVEWHVGDVSVLKRVFTEDVYTRLPYRVFRRKLDAPLEREPVYTEAMCSEDNIILVDNRVNERSSFQSQGRNFRILTF
ncbi:hypothetical protein JVU11DRAFT_5019 [Chiua virens]|nr:hypothetical protein JVU11DRAFT_5019 [Chiua virens]